MFSGCVLDGMSSKGGWCLFHYIHAANELNYAGDISHSLLLLLTFCMLSALRSPSFKQIYLLTHTST